MFGNITLTNAGLNDIFVVKYNPQGNVAWAKRAGGTNFDDGNGIVTDEAGNSYVTGMYRGTATFGSFILSHPNDPEIFVAKYDSAGNVLWAKSAGGSDVDQGWGIGLDLASNCYISGNFFSSTAAFGPVSVLNSATTFYPSEIFVAKLSRSITTSDNLIIDQEEILTYPNPVHDNLTITSKEEMIQILLFDISGREISNNEASGNEFAMHNLRLTPGIYFVKIITKKGYTYRKIEVF